MKYFSREWHGGDIPVGDLDEVRERYWAFISSITDSLPEPIRELATVVNLHDGLVQELVVDHQKGSVDILLRCGDLQVGYSDVRLVYSGVPTSALDEAVLQEIATDPESELLYDEVDRSATGYVHRVLFWPYREVQIDFTALRIARVPKPDRSIAADFRARFRSVGNRVV
ncbi:MAG: DUF4085 family protein [Usitatibacteraceae bacterium]